MDGEAEFAEDSVTRQKIPVYVINLDRRPDRWQAISERLDRLGIEASRIAAVDAHRILPPGDVPTRPRIMAAVANMKSQARAMRLLLESAHPAALILEDDAVLAGDTPALLESAEWWPDGFSIVRLEAGKPVFRAMHDPCGETPTGRELRPVGKWIGGAAAYMVDRHGAAQVVKAFSKPFQTVDRSRSVDRTLFDLRISRIARRLRPVQIVPGMAYQVDSPSDYDEWRKIVPMAGWRKRYWQMRSVPFLFAHYWPLRARGRIRDVHLGYSEWP